MWYQCAQCPHQLVAGYRLINYLVACLPFTASCCGLGDCFPSGFHLNDEGGILSDMVTDGLAFLLLTACGRGFPLVGS